MTKKIMANKAIYNIYNVDYNYATKHGRWGTIVSSIRSLTQIKEFKPLKMSVDLYSRSLILILF